MPKGSFWVFPKTDKTQVVYKVCGDFAGIYRFLAGIYRFCDKSIILSNFCRGVYKLYAKTLYRRRLKLRKICRDISLFRGGKQPSASSSQDCAISASNSHLERKIGRDISMRYNIINSMKVYIYRDFLRGVYIGFRAPKCWHIICVYKGVYKPPAIYKFCTENHLRVNCSYTATIRCSSQS